MNLIPDGMCTAHVKRREWDVNFMHSCHHYYVLSCFSPSSLTARLGKTDEKNTLCDALIHSDFPRSASAVQLYAHMLENA